MSAWLSLTSRSVYVWKGSLKSGPVLCEASLFMTLIPLILNIIDIFPGDAIKVQSAGTTAKETHKGIVHDIGVDHVRISFHKSFVGTGRRFNVCFSLNRTPLRRQHQALTVTCPASRELLFPLPGHEGVAAPLHPTASPVTLYNAAIGNNAAQLQAVRTIINLREGSAAFIVFGP